MQELHPPENSAEPTTGRLGAAVCLLSFGVLTVEICLTRIFSFTITYHFAYLTIAVALLGFGSAGSVLAAYPELFGSTRRRFVISTSAASVSSVAALAFTAAVRFDPIAIGSNPQALAILALYYVVVTVPFFFAGLAVATVFTCRPERIGTLYAWDLLGAALGCAVSVPIIWQIETPAAVSSGALAIGAAALLLCAGDGRLRRGVLSSLVFTLIAGVAVSGYVTFSPSPGKFLSNFLASPGVNHLFKRWTPINRVDAVGWNAHAGSWRGSYAVSGVSPRYRGRGPEFRMVGYDGGSFAVMYQWNGGDRELDLFRHHVMAAPYRLLDEPRTLIIGLGGGADALAGVANGVGPMIGLELNPVTVDLGKNAFEEFNGGLFNSPRLEVIPAEARHWVESHPQRFDLIVLNSIDTLAALSSGAYVLAESYLYTVEAFNRYLDHLDEGGIFALFSFDNNGVAGPTFIILRYLETLRRALLSRGVRNPGRNLAVFAGSEDTPLVATLVKKSGFTQEDVEALDAFADSQGFRFWQHPLRPVDHQVSRYLNASSEEQTRFREEHYLRLDAVTDASPFFFNFYKWRSLLRRDPRDSGTTPATGQRMLLAMLAQAVLFSIVLILWPLRRLPRDRMSKRPSALLLYFAALGIGFIFIEISLMQRFVLFLGYPTYSLSVVLFSLLTFTGLGSAITGKIPSVSARPAQIAAVLLAMGLAVFMLVAPGLFEANLAQSLERRILLSVLLIAPLGLILGTFFPLGIRLIQATDRRLVPWAWAVNGCSTVIGTILATMLAMAYGFDFVMLLALATYGVGCVALGLAQKPSGRMAASLPPST